MAQNCEKHSLLEFRRIAALLYRKNQRWDQSLKLSKTDNQHKDCCDTALESRNPQLINDILFYFRDNDIPEGFIACTYTAFEIIRPETIMEVAWMKGWQDFAMPYYIQLSRDMHNRLSYLEKKISDKEKKEEQDKSKQAETPIETFDMNMMMPGLSGYQALMPPPQMGVPMTGMPMAGMPGMPGMDPNTMPYTSQPQYRPPY